MSAISVHEPIDFVLIWVDGSDPTWQAERARYAEFEGAQTDTRVSRYRDWDNLRYWFRAVEEYTPWVRKVHFVTWGHVPGWLDLNNPKLNLVRHEDYIPHEYLPTFSSHVIELNLHRIEGLAEHFVYFNDDMFVLKPMNERMFFHDGLPCDCAVLNAHCYDMDEMFVLAPFRDVGIINRHFDMKRVIRNNPIGWFNPAYGPLLLRNVILLSCPRFPGFWQPHTAASYLKSTFVQVWKAEPEILSETCKHRFRGLADVNQWVFKEWQLASNQFHPRKASMHLSISAEHIENACRAIELQRAGLFCLNDVEMDEVEFERAAQMVRGAFDKILPNPSSFEVAGR